MIINITERTTIRDIQIKFNKEYPFLKIEFSDKPHKSGQPTKGGHWLYNGYKILHLAKKHHPGWIIIHPWHRTDYIEQQFAARFGLYAQVFRNNNQIWIETAGTDVLSLEEQNEIGKRMKKDLDLYWREREMLL